MRSQEIRVRLEGFCREELGIDVGEAEMSDWLAWPLPDRYRFGWMPPVDVTEDGGDEPSVLFMFSPNLMGAVLDKVSRSDFEDYLTLVEFVLAKHVELRGKSTDEVMRLSEEMLYERVPDALKMRLEVEARALGEVVPAR